MDSLRFPPAPTTSPPHAPFVFLIFFKTNIHTPYANEHIHYWQDFALSKAAMLPTNHWVGMAKMEGGGGRGSGLGGGVNTRCSFSVNQSNVCGQQQIENHCRSSIKCPITTLGNAIYKELLMPPS